MSSLWSRKEPNLLISINDKKHTRARPIIRIEDLTLGADTSAAFGRCPTLMGTTDAGTKMVGCFDTPKKIPIDSSNTSKNIKKVETIISSLVPVE